MALYTFFLHDGSDEVPRFELELLDGPDTAASHARKLLVERPHYATVVIADGETEIARVERENV